MICGFLKNPREAYVERFVEPEYTGIKRPTLCLIASAFKDFLRALQQRKQSKIWISMLIYELRYYKVNDKLFDNMNKHSSKSFTQNLQLVKQSNWELFTMAKKRIFICWYYRHYLRNKAFKIEDRVDQLRNLINSIVLKFKEGIELKIIVIIMKSLMSIIVFDIHVRHPHGRKNKLNDGSFQPFLFLFFSFRICITWKGNPIDCNSCSSNAVNLMP